MSFSLSVCLSVCLQSVFESKGFSEVSADTLSYLLQSDRLNMEEEDILDKVKEWANISSVSGLHSSPGRGMGHLESSGRGRIT